MLKLIATSHPSGKVNLGETCEYRLEGNPGNIQTRTFLKHMGLMYLKPVKDWNADPMIRFFPEAPGDYTVSVEWRDPSGQSGWLENRFAVTTAAQIINHPRIARVDRNVEMWFPSDWEAQLFANYEKPVFDMLKELVKPGWVIYDVGANFGYYSIQLARLVGDQGRVYCFEANPLCVYFLLANLQQNQIVNYDIFPGALLDENRQINFTINYANSALGVTQKSNFYQTKVGHQIGVDSYCLDELYEVHHLRRPDLMKIDVEGAEGYVIAGMLKIIQQHRPYLLLEIHGQEPAAQTLAHLRTLPYTYQVLGQAEAFDNADDLLRWFPDAVVQLLGVPSPQ